MHSPEGVVSLVSAVDASANPEDPTPEVELEPGVVALVPVLLLEPGVAHELRAVAVDGRTFAAHLHLDAGTPRVTVELTPVAGR